MNKFSFYYLYISSEHTHTQGHEYSIVDVDKPQL